MSPPNRFPGQVFTPCIITGGHESDVSDVQSLARCASPYLHGKNIDVSKLPYIAHLTAPTQQALETDAPPGEPGTMGLMVQQTGEPSSRILMGLFPQVNQPHGGAGGTDLTSAINGYMKALQTTTGKNIPPKIVEKIERGAVRRVVEEKGKEWSHMLTKGLEIHATPNPLRGAILPAMKNIETAKQQFMNILNSSMLGNLPGTFMSLSSLFSKMGDNNKKKIKKKLPPDLADTLESLIELLHECDAGSTFFTDGRVHEETFIENAIELLSEATSADDLYERLLRLLTDTSLHGLENLQCVSIEIEGPFGNVIQSIECTTGNVTIQLSNTAQSSMESFTSMLSSSSAAAGAAPGSNMFNLDASTMVDMLGRIPPQIQKFRNEILKYVNNSPEARKMTTALDENGRTKSGNPLGII